MADDWGFDEAPEKEQPKRGPGRPRGAKAKPRGFKEILTQFEQVYKRIEEMLTEDQKKYYRDAFSGKKPYDPIKEMELFMRLYSLYTSVVVTDALEQRTPKREVAEVVNQFRQGNKEIEEMYRKREEAKVKSGESADVVDPTRKSTLARFKGFRGEPSDE